MGCSASRSVGPQPTQLVQIGAAKASRPAVRNDPPKTKPLRVRKRIDFHCSACGVTKESYPNYRHKCEPGPVGYQVFRQSVCDQCEFNADGVCMSLKAIHPDRPCLIEVGVAAPGWRCPERKWDRTLWRCDKCGSQVFDEHGMTRCPVCHPPVKPSLVDIPEFKDYPVKPKSKFAVVTVATGQHAMDLAKLTWPRMRAYAEFLGADFVTITDNQSPAWPVANKFRIGKVCSRYTRTLYLDSDTWIRPGIGNVFERFESGKFWMFPDMSKKNCDWSSTKQFSARFSHDYGVPFMDMKCHNSGVVLFDRSNWDCWNPPKKLGTWWVAEQYWVARQAIARGVLADLPPEMNTQWYWPDFTEQSAKANVVHFAACPHGERIARIKELVRTDSGGFA